MKNNGSRVPETNPPRRSLEIRGTCITELHRSGFNDFDEETNVIVLESSDLQPTLKAQTFDDSEELLNHLTNTGIPRIRIVSIPQASSYEALQISLVALEGLLGVHAVSPDFLHALLATGRPPRESEGGFGNAIVNRYDDSSFDLTYLSRYYGKREDSWKLRQTGVYHAYDAGSKSHLYILLHPEEGGAFQKKVESLADATTLLYSEPMIIHELLFQSYIGNWRGFLKDKGSEFQSSAEKLFAVPYSKTHFLGISFEGLQWWRDLEDRVLPTTSILQATLGLLESLDSIDAEIKCDVRQAAAPDRQRRLQSEFFKSRRSVVEAYIASAAGLQQRIHGAVSLLCDTLELKNKEELQSINENLLGLQRESVDDNETVRVITGLTLVYLPGSFVATLLGTNLFFFNPDTSRMRIASNAWWYLVLFVPFMFITAWIFWAKTGTSRKKRKDRKANLKRQAEGSDPDIEFSVSRKGPLQGQ